MVYSRLSYHRNNHQRISLPLILLSIILCLLCQAQVTIAIRGIPSTNRRCRQQTNACQLMGYVTSLQTNNIIRKQYTRNIVWARKKQNDFYDDDEDWDDYYDNEDDVDDDEYYNRRRRRRRRPSVDNLGTPPLTGSSPDDTSLSIPSSFGRGDTGIRMPSSVSAALLAGVFVLGIGTGVTVDSQINTNPKDLASRDAVDKNAPNPTLCTTYGASAMAFDQRVFVSFNPFNVYVAQADVKPACVLRPSNVVPVLKERKLINDNEIRGCKMNMNTWAFVGDLNDQPQLSCVYKSEDAQNEFLEDPKRGIGEDYLDDDRDKLIRGSGKKKTGKLVKDNLTEAQKKMIVDMGEKQVGGGGAEMF